MIKKLVLLVCVTFALAATVSADIPVPPCYPGCVLTVPAR
jgi:hypothetical protein